MNTAIALAFCLLLGLMIRAQGWSAVIWVPLGFLLGLFLAANTLLLLILGVPRAVRLVSARKMRPAILGVMARTLAIWAVVVGVPGLLVWHFWPAATDWLKHNIALQYAVLLAAAAIVVSPLSRKNLADFRADFDKAYAHFAKISDVKDLAMVFPLLMEAAKLGDPESQRNVAICYASGAGVEQDHDAAMLWCRRAAEGDDAEAQYMFGRCCVLGSHIEANPVEGYVWIRKALKQGHPEAREALAAATTLMSQAQLEEANWLCEPLGDPP